MKVISKERMIAGSVPENIHSDFKIECFNRGLKVKQALAQAVKIWMLTDPDQKKSPVPTLGLIENKSKIIK